jgi:hypothetical protein
MTVIMWLSGSSSYTDNDYSIVSRAACSHGWDVLLSIVENRSQLHSLIKVSQRLITIEFYIRWPTGLWPAQISLLVVVFLLTSNQQFADFHQWKSVPTFLIYQGPSTEFFGWCWSNVGHQLRYHLISDPASNKQRYQQSTIRRFRYRRSW